jgi:hypothetical protein
MSANPALTIYALQRVLFHLGEDQQARQPGDYIINGAFAGRAAARVEVKRRLAFAELSAARAWQAAKDRSWGTR